MAIEFDQAKSDRNSAERGIPFIMAEAFDWQTAKVRQDMRSDYGEPRFIALGRIDAKVYVLVFTPRGQNVRVISLRRANEREIRAYGET